MKYALALSFLVGFLPLASQAAVTINEIAWMGDSSSPNHEWIELYNDGGSVNVDGWSLTDGNNINLSLSGTINGGDYAVLERTSDDSAPGTAFAIYTGALKNSGATLTLRRADNGVEDQVAGGENWQNLGGDNETKDTAQYTTSGWITATPTPGFANTSPPVQQTNTSSGSSGSAKLAEPVERDITKLKLPGVTLELDLLAPDQVFVNQPVNFDVVPDGVGDTIASSLNYTWNFGDTNVSDFKSPSHIFTYPGTYVVHVSAEYARQQAYTTKEITVLPVAISLTKNSEGDIQINNDSPYKVNLSDYRLRAGEVLEIPDNTWLLPRQTITVESAVVDAVSKQLTALYDASGEMVASLMPGYLVSQTAPEPTPVTTPVVRNSIHQSQVADFQFVSETEVIENTAEITEPTLGTKTESVSPDSISKSFDWTVVALVVLLSLGCIVILMKPLKSENGLDKHG